MGIKSAIIKTYARRVTRSTAHWSHQALDSQEKMMKLLVNKASLTQFGKQHNFHKIVTYYDFRHLIPISKVSDLQQYIQLIKKGDKDILWPGLPKYLLHTQNDSQSLLPVTKESLPGFFDGLKMLLFNQVDWIDKNKVFKGKILFLTNPHQSQKSAGIHIGDINWMYTQKIPAWLKSNVILSEITPDNAKLSNELNKYVAQDIRLIVGSPENFFLFNKAILGHTNELSLKKVYPNLSTIVWSLLSASQNEILEKFKLEDDICTLKMYASALGCWAFQDRINDKDVLLNVNSGLFFEFISLESHDSEAPKRLNLPEVELEIPYKLILSNNAGCWACDAEVHLKFTGLKPFRIEIL